MTFPLMTAGTAPTTSFGDVIDNTLAHYVKGFQQTQKYQDYPLMRNALFGAGKKEDAGGRSHVTHLRLRPKNTVRWVGYFDVGSLNYVDVGTQLESTFRHFEQDMTWDQKLVSHNSSAERVNNFITEQWDGAYEALWNDIEEKCVGAPFNETDVATVRGLEYWGRPLGAGVVDQTGGFNGQTIVFGDGTTATVIAAAAGGANGNDASLASNANLRNWVATHTGDMDNTTLEILVRARNRTDFKTIPDLSGGGQGGIALTLMSMDFKEKYDRLVQKAPDDWGNDAAGRSAPGSNNRIAGMKIMQSPVIDGKATQDIYGLNTSHLYGVTLGGMWMEKSDARLRDGSPTVWYSHLYGSCLIHCDNPRQAIFRIHAVR